MAGPFRRKSIPKDVEQRLRIAAAVAAEEVLEEHVRSAVEMVEEGGDRAPVERLIAAYVRLHHLADADRRKLRERVLATLGRDPRNAQLVAALDAPRSPWRRLRQRIRGRVHLDLRHWVERHTARVELSLIDLHVRHVLEFLRLMGPETGVALALDRYARLLDLRDVVTEMVRLKVLKALHDREHGQVEPFHGPRAAGFPLRVADQGT